MNLTTLIEQAAANRRPIVYQGVDRGLSYLSSAIWPSPVGTIICEVDHTVRNPGSRNKHVRVTFRLNGPRIARAKLEELLKSV
jgi:hypothetical protein